MSKSRGVTQNVTDHTDSSVKDISMPTDKYGNNLPPSPQERGDALHLIKEYARKGYMQADGATEEKFEELRDSGSQLSM